MFFAIHKAICGSLIVTLLCACGGGGGGGGGSTVPASFTVGGNVSGLGSGDSVILSDNVGAQLTVDANGSFTFKTPIAENGAYKVAVTSQPVGQGCTVSMGSGAGINANVTNVGVVCANLSKAWGLTGNMSTPRAFFQAVLLQNGNVLVAGGQVTYYQIGDNYSATSTASAEFYNPSSGSWTPTGDMSTARQFFTATLLPDGTVLAAGGIAYPGPGPDAFPPSLTSAEIFDPATGTWTPTGSMSTGREGHAATLLPNGTVLVVDGSENPSAEIYTPATHSWAPTGSPSSPNTADTLLTNGKVLGTGSLDALDEPTGTCEIYDPVAGIWTLTGSMPEPIAGFPILLANGTVLVAGGDLVTGTDAEIYTPTTGVWEETGSLPYPYPTSATLLSDGTVLVAGGTIVNNQGGNIHVGAAIYTPASGTWTVTGSMNIDRDGQSATLLPNGNVLAAGGISGGLSTDSAEIYYP